MEKEEEGRRGGGEEEEEGERGFKGCVCEGRPPRFVGVSETAGGRALFATPLFYGKIVANVVVVPSHFTASRSRERERERETSGLVTEYSCDARGG